jgi:hypothetical protein
MGYSVSVALSLALEMNLQHLIQADNPTSLDSLAQQTGGSRKLISKTPSLGANSHEVVYHTTNCMDTGCVMSQLASNHIFEMVELDTYRHNDFSKILLDKSLAAWIHMM